MCNVNLIMAFCRAMSKKGDGAEFLRLDKISDMVKERERLMHEEHILLKNDVTFDERLMQRHLKEILEAAQADEDLRSLIGKYIYKY